MIGDSDRGRNRAEHSFLGSVDLEWGQCLALAFEPLAAEGAGYGGRWLIG